MKLETPNRNGKGIKVGAPPTFVLNKHAAKIIVDNVDKPEYQDLGYDDVTMRNLLFDHGVVIEQIRTQRPIFGYVVHGGNTSMPG